MTATISPHWINDNMISLRTSTLTFPVLSSKVHYLQNPFVSPSPSRPSPSLFSQFSLFPYSQRELLTAAQRGMLLSICFLLILSLRSPFAPFCPSLLRHTLHVGDSCMKYGQFARLSDIRTFDADDDAVVIYLHTTDFFLHVGGIRNTTQGGEH